MPDIRIRTIRITPNAAKRVRLSASIADDTEQGDRNRTWTAAGVTNHVVEFRQHLDRIAGTDDRDPAIAIGNGPGRALQETAANMERRIRFCAGFAGRSLD
jgi:hypothetical protein